MANQQQGDIEIATQTYGDIATGYEEMDRARRGPAQGSYPAMPSNYSQAGPGNYMTGRGNVISIGTPPGGSGRGGMLNAGARGTRGGTGSKPYQRASSQPYSTGYQGPMVDKPVYQKATLKGPGKYKAPEYAPPERDEGVERKLRRESMAPGMRQVRRATSEAIISSKSMDNPNARAMFIQKALTGVGDAISGVTAAAGREARAGATQRHAEDISKYNMSWNALSDEAKTNYNSSWQVALANFNEQRSANQSSFNLQSNVYSQMPLAQKAGDFESGAGPSGIAKYNAQYGTNY